MKKRLWFQLVFLAAAGLLTVWFGLASRAYADNPTGENVELLSQLWGGFNALYVDGNSAYISEGSKLVILDISNPVTPTVTGRTAVSTGLIEGIFVANNRAYLADAYQGLRIIDVTTPATLAELGVLSLPGQAHDVFVVGTTAYVAAGLSGLRIIDVNNPAAPSELGAYETPGLAKSVVVSGTTAYVAADEAGLRIIDVSNPADPDELGFYQAPVGDNVEAGDVSVVNNTAYVAYTAGGLRVIDVTNPASPAEVGFYITPHETKGVYAADNTTVYVTDEDEGVQIIDVTNPLSPTLTGSENGGEGEDVHVAGNHAYVVNRGGTLRVVDVSNLAAPNEVGYYSGVPDLYPPYVVDNKAYLGYWDGQGGMQILDVSDPANPTQLGAFTDFHIGQIVVSGTLAHITNNNFHTFDVSDPANPTILSFLSGDPDGTEGLAVADNKAYVANGDVGLRIIDVSLPINPNPTVLGSYDTPGSATDVFVSGSRAYVADENEGLRIIDVSDSGNPVELGFYDTPGEAVAVHVAGNIAYVADEGNDPNSGLLLIDVTDPGSPTLVGTYHTTEARDVYVIGNIAYFVEQNDGLHIFDVSDPTSLTEVGSFPLVDASGVYVVGNTVYVSCGNRGFAILRFTGVPPTFTASGQVTDGGSNPVSGVTISTNGGQQRATNSSGVYTLTNLLEGEYTLTPYKAGYTFTPVTRSVTISPSVSGQDFTAAPIVLTGTIQGQVTTAGSTPVAGIVVLAYQNQSDTWFVVDSTTTGGDGNYALSLPVGNYRLYFADTNQDYVNEYYDDQANLSDGADVPVTAGQTTANINADLEETPPPQVEVSGGASTSVNRQTGEVTVRGSSGQTSQVTIIRTISDAGGAPTNVTLLVGSRAFPMTAGGNNQYSVTLTIPDDLPNTSGLNTMTIQYQADAAVSVPVGDIGLYDPSGQITNDDGQPIAGAVVSLYRVAGALPDQDGQTNDCRTVDTRPGGRSGDWSGVPAAALDAGNWVNPDLSAGGGFVEISPAINPQVTGSDGRYAWDTVEGCWYVVVEAAGYDTIISPLVGVPPEVTDLDLVLTGGEIIYLPIIVK